MLGNLRKENESLRQAIAAAEKERDEAIDKFHAEIRRGRQACNEIMDMELKAQREKYEAKLSLYESAPSEPEIKEPLAWADDIEPDGAWVKNVKALARALRACQAKLAVSAIANRLAQNVEADKILARALVAESELAACRAKIEEARQVLEVVQEVLAKKGYGRMESIDQTIARLGPKEAA